MATSATVTELPQELLRDLVLEDLQVPVVFHGLIDQWEPLHWGLEGWEREIGSQPMNFRIGKQFKEGGPQWERTCEIDRATLKQFIQWQNGLEAPLRGTANDVRPLRRHTPEEVWAYFDYKYMHEVFQGNPSVLLKFNWSRFGFPERDGSQSVLWIGSKGAHTPCHWDTYGCNLVAQLFGRKRWLIFPPSQSQYLMQTRVPYEESSVYSDVNFFSGHLYDSSKYPDLDKTTPYVVTLEPGDVLFVPHHWWHFVESLDTSVSVNTWLELPSDDESRVTEATVKFFVSLLCRELKKNDQQFVLNPNEDRTVNTPLYVLLSFIQVPLQKYISTYNQNRGKKRKLEYGVQKKLKKRQSDSEHLSPVYYSEDTSNEETNSEDTCVNSDKVIGILQQYPKVITLVEKFTFAQYLEMTQRISKKEHTNMDKKDTEHCLHIPNKMTLKMQNVGERKNEDKSMASGVDQTPSSENSLEATSSSSDGFVSDCEDSSSDMSEDTNTDFLKLIVNSWTHPRVVQEVKKVLLENIHSNY